jgi:hypothetical protein
MNSRRKSLLGPSVCAFAIAANIVQCHLVVSLGRIGLEEDGLLAAALRTRMVVGARQCWVLNDVRHDLCKLVHFVCYLVDVYAWIVGQLLVIAISALQQDIRYSGSGLCGRMKRFNSQRRIVAWFLCLLWGRACYCLKDEEYSNAAGSDAGNDTYHCLQNLIPTNPGPSAKLSSIFDTIWFSQN